LYRRSLSLLTEKYNKPLFFDTLLDSVKRNLRSSFVNDILQNIVLFGLEKNRKTAFTNVLTAMHGVENVSNVPLSEML
jgi:hypothetical protein